ncbi:MAG: glycosyltransferase family A protein [Alphaproteobacteria bacterium]|jgi:glycosyltransferase involved in cell wall biosynthesis
MPLFTVFTPSYNRAHTIHRVYESLQQQTFRDFEWLVVDDGSTDNTKSIVEAWKKEAPFPIRYVWQENGHKKKALNHGIRLASGELFLTADSDDAFLPTALERFAHHWLAIPENERIHFAGVCGLCQDPQGNIVGDPFPGDWGMDSDSLEMRHKFGVRGEKWGFNRTDILRAQPFPEHLPGYVPEGVVWTAIAARYKTRFINEVVRTYFQDAGNQVTQARNPARDTVGSLYWKSIVLNNELKWFKHNPVYFLTEAARWTRFRLHLDVSQAPQERFWPVSAGGRLLVVLMAPMGLAWWLYDCWKRRSH